MADKPIVSERAMLEAIRAADTNRDDRLEFSEMDALAKTGDPTKMVAANAISDSLKRRAGTFNPYPSVRMDQALEDAKETFRTMDKTHDGGISQTEIDYSQRSILQRFQSYDNFVKKNADKNR